MRLFAAIFTSHSRTQHQRHSNALAPTPAGAKRFVPLDIQQTSPIKSKRAREYRRQRKSPNAPLVLLLRLAKDNNSPAHIVRECFDSVAAAETFAARLRANGIDIHSPKKTDKKYGSTA